MTMQSYNSDILQAMKWMHSNAPNIQLLVKQKSDWYDQFYKQFWIDWERTVFDLRTASPFGIRIWCEILGVPSSLFGLYLGDATSWAYGPDRQNFKYSHTDPNLPNPNLIGGNFFGGGETTILNIQEARWALMLRYAALVSNGRISFINRMLAWIFNDGNPWNFPGKRYFYVTDCTAPAQTLTPTAPVANPFVMEYRIGANLEISEQFLNLMNTPKYGIVPTCAGSKYQVIQEN